MDGLTNSATSASQSGAAGLPGGDVVLAGKYRGKTLEEAAKELERGYANQMSETQKIIAQRDEVAKKLEAVLPLLERASEGSERAMPGARAAERKSYLDSLSETLNVDRNQLAGAIAEVSAYQLAPLTKGIQARQIVAQEAPDFVKFEGEVAQFLQANPAINERFTTMMAVPELADAALKYAFLEWKNSAGAARTDTSGSSQAAAKIDASVSAGTTGSRDANSQAVYDKAIAEAKQKGENTGDWTEWLRLRLDGVIPDSFYRGK